MTLTMAKIAPGQALTGRYQAVRRQTEDLCAPLEPEDMLLQSMPDASPVKWHLAHTTWFFETFLLIPYLPGYRVFHPQFAVLFNSYYQAVGPRWPRAQRGLLSRPTLAEVRAYRAQVDEGITQLLETGQDLAQLLAERVLLGINHEQQHQELILTDLKHAWSNNPLRPVYRDTVPEQGSAPALTWQEFPEGLAWIGHEGTGFAFDNELPRHRTFLEGFQLASRLVTCGEYLAFINEGGYRRPELWLSDGWSVCQTQGWTAPLYWMEEAGSWSQMTLGGLEPVRADVPVCHVSFYEADAFARWAGARLPTEAEWEVAAEPSLGGHFLEGGRFHPAAVPAEDDQGPLVQTTGDVWQWTSSAYLGYPGYQPAEGALGEYNGKFMCNQFVLRGASCVTPRSHARRSYRNFFSPDARWQFSGVRLAKDLS
jgi:ergothioneine biosynthesis protein EgtB